MHPTILDAAADLLLGAACPGCGRPGWGVCLDCTAAVEGPVRHLDRAIHVPLTAAAPYRPVLNHVIPRYKDDGALHLGGFLARLLARAVWDLAPPQDTVLVPVPSRREAVRSRGYDHAARIAAGAARAVGSTHRRLLRRPRAGQDQAGLGRDSRQRNLEDAMVALAAPWPVVVVDDITTTGASLRESVRALEAAGVRVVGAAVIADADYR